MDEVVQRFPRPREEEAEAAAKDHEPLRVAVVGRPNVGKSTLINRLLGFERAVVAATPGTTRDSLDTPFELNGKPCVLIDTAGIRRKARIDDRVEGFSVSLSLRSVDRGDLIIHVIDGPEGVTDQDAQILSYAAQRGKALLLAVNKWDLLGKGGADSQAYRDEVYHQLSFVNYAPVVFIAAATGYGVRKMIASAARMVEVYQRKVMTSRLNQTLQRIVRAHTPPLWQGKAVKFYYGTQTGTRPPTFTLFVNQPRGVPESYRRYLTHQLRESLGLEGSPVKLIFRPRREEKKQS
jgi:GTP-binding protein